jgi:hypothetical protein
MNLELVRFYTPTETTGVLVVDGFTCVTIERPWIGWTYPGGKPFESCIPEGTYRLEPYMRRNGDRAFAIINPSRGVCLAKADRPREPNGERLGRYKCLIHGRANYVGDVQGCAAVGQTRVISPSRLEVMVTSSTATMKKLLEAVPWESGHTLRIRQVPGAIDSKVSNA